MALHILLVALLMITTVYRRRLPYNLRSGFVITFFIAIGIGGLWNFGLLSGAVPFLLIVPIMAAALLSLKWSLLLLAIATCAAGTIGFAIVNGLILIPIDPAAYTVSAPAWILALVGWILTSGSTALAVAVLVRVLLEALKSSQQHAKALEQSEAQHRRLIQNLPQIVYTWSSATGFLYCSNQLERTLAITAEELCENSELWTQRIHYEDIEIFQRARNALEENRRFNIVYRIHDKEGGCHWFHDICTDIRREGEEIIIDGLATDITAQQEAEEKLRQSQKMEAVGQLTGGIAHDFNNLLSIMMLNTEFLEEDFGAAHGARARLTMLKQAVAKASSLTNRLLAFSRRQVLQPEVIDINQLLAELKDLLHRTLGETITVTITPAIDLCAAKIDRHQLDNALINLAINAKDAMPHGGQLKIRAKNLSIDATSHRKTREMEPGDYVRISVEDTGEGIPKDVIDHIFDPFFTTKEVGQGSGLGLSMVYGFVTQSGGYVTVDSKALQGTTFRLYLPRTLEPPRNKKATVASAGDSPSGARILVVEDDADVRMVPVLILRKQGYEVIEASDGKQALDLLETSAPFDLLFTDLVMPGPMNGIELAEEAVRRQSDLKVLFTSGYTKELPLKSPHLLTDLPILNKPYQRSDLLIKIRSALAST